MTRSLGTILAFFTVWSFVGCARRTRVPVAPPTQPVATTQPSTHDPRALLALDQIQPLPRFDEPSTHPSTPPAAPLEALELFARARDARARNQPFSAINLLEQALRLDPDGFEPNLALGSAYHRVGNVAQAIEAYTRAARANPRDLVLQAELGRAYLQRGDAERGVQHLRLARATEEYGQDPAFAAAVDYRLAVALQQAGYDTAALEVYDRLLERLRSPTTDVRRNPEVAYLLNRPELLFEQVGELSEKHGQHERALAAWRFITDRAPDNVEAHARVVRTLLAMGRTDEALKSSVELVAQFRASPESLALMRDVHRAAGRERSLVDELNRLRARRPQDRVVLFALSDALESSRRPTEAEELLASAARERDGDAGIVARLAALYAARGQRDRAARALVEAAARRPNAAGEYLPAWSDL